MTYFLRLTRLYPNLRSRSARQLPVAVLLTAAVLAAGCSAAQNSANATSPQQAVADAARQAAQISSATSTISEQIGGAAGESITGTVTEQLKPSLLMAMQLNLGAAGGGSDNIDGIINTKAMYLHSSAFTQHVGKPWLEIPFSILGGSKSSLGQLFKSLDKINPAQQTAVLAAARHVRKVGTAVIDGVPTTHYAGTILPATGLSVLPPALRKELAPELKQISGSIRFDMWVDAQKHIRKTTEVETVAGETISTTVTFSAIDQPVHVTLPPRSQVAVIPASALGGASA